MNVAPTHPMGTLAWSATSADRSSLSRRAKAGTALRLAPGLYAVGAALSPEEVTRHHLMAIVASYWPGGVLCGRSALARGVIADGTLFVAHPDPPRQTPITLPGATVRPVVRPGPLPGDLSMPNDLSLSGPARVLVENVVTRGRPGAHQGGLVAVEDRIDSDARAGGAGRIQEILDQLDVIAVHYDPAAVSAVRDRLRLALGSAIAGVAVSSTRFGARLAGAPYDAHRVEMLEQLAAALERRQPVTRAVGGSPVHWEWLPFFEAYFSNFIEGTEFGVDEARRIAMEGLVPVGRPADAHDVAATYRLAVDPEDRSRVPTSGEELAAVLRVRHAVLMAARPDKRPGLFKERMNDAGGYQFVEPDLVVGTLTRGYAVIDRLLAPLARAVAMMVLITECHPFDDGNGRVARLTANAELSAAGQVRLLVPTVCRNEYLGGLSAISNGAAAGQSLVAVLDHVQRWAAAVDWSGFERAHTQLTAGHAYVDPGIAATTGQLLEFPS